MSRRPTIAFRQSNREDRREAGDSLGDVGMTRRVGGVVIALPAKRWCGGTAGARLCGRRCGRPPRARRDDRSCGIVIVAAAAVPAAPLLGFGDSSVRLTGDRSTGHRQAEAEPHPSCATRAQVRRAASAPDTTRSEAMYERSRSAAGGSRGVNRRRGPQIHASVRSPRIAPPGARQLGRHRFGSPIARCVTRGAPRAISQSRPRIHSHPASTRSLRSTDRAVGPGSYDKSVLRRTFFRSPPFAKAWGSRRLDLFDPEMASLYLTRWRLLRTRFVSVKLHHIVRSDNPRRGFHDHPWSFVSLRLSGRYIEHILDGNNVRTEEGRRISFRRAHEFHRIELIRDAPCWTLVITGSRSKSWGFAPAPSPGARVPDSVES